MLCSTTVRSPRCVLRALGCSSTHLRIPPAKILAGLVGILIGVRVPVEEWSNFPHCRLGLGKAYASTTAPDSGQENMHEPRT